MPTAADAAISDATFARALAALGPFEPKPRMAIAVSGGADSVALMALAARWLESVGGSGTVLTVDHGRRPAARLEAAWVAALAARLGLQQRTLRWPSSRGALRSQEQARGARYALLDAACAGLGALHLLVAHHADDQDQTIAMRHRRGPGLGLAGMAPIRELRRCRILRPLLRFRARELRATAATLGCGWIEDPSNQDERYERSRCADTPRLPVRTKERAVLEREAAAWLAHHGRRLPGHGLRFDLLALDGLNPAARARLVAAGAGHVGGCAYRPSARRAGAALARLATGHQRVTLAGAILERDGGALYLRPEAGISPTHAVPLAPAPFAAPDVASDTTDLIC